MDFVHKQNVIFLEVGEQSRQIPRLFNGGAGGDTDLYPHLVGDDAAEGGFAQARGAMEQHVVQGFSPHFGRLDEHLQVGLGLGLADVLIQGLRPQRGLPVVRSGQRGADQGLKVRPFIFVVGKINAHICHTSFSGPCA